MSIEKDIFKRCKIDYNRLEDYGFKKENNIYTIEKNFLKDFKAIIIIENDTISGKVIDLETNCEYLNIKTNMNGEFVNSIREKYKEILFDIKNQCCINKYFISDQANRITEQIKNIYNDDPEFLWENLDGSGVFRNKNSNKWYGIIMNIDISKIDKGHGEVEVLNVKLQRDEIEKLLNQKGYYKAYHMNKKDWISIILNDTLSDDIILKLIDESYKLVN